MYAQCYTLSAGMYSQVASLTCRARLELEPVTLDLKQAGPAHTSFDHFLYTVVRRRGRLFAYPLSTPPYRQRDLTLMRLAGCCRTPLSCDGISMNKSNSYTCVCGRCFITKYAISYDQPQIYGCFMMRRPSNATPSFEKHVLAYAFGSRHL